MSGVRRREKEEWERRGGRGKDRGGGEEKRGEADRRGEEVFHLQIPLHLRRYLLEGERRMRERKKQKEGKGKRERKRKSDTHVGEVGMSDSKRVLDGSFC